MRDLQDWLQSQEYLPPFLRDFHDQKDLFKAIHWRTSTNESTQALTWVQAHCYVIDVFLWWMAARGYTLQKTRVKCEFRDLKTDIEEHENASRDVLLSMFNQPKH
jgi:hypothetical protein